VKMRPRVRRIAGKRTISHPEKIDRHFPGATHGHLHK